MANLRKRRFPYTAVACEKCQRRKIKCSGENPCKGCRDSEHECVYLRSTRFRSSRRLSNGASTQGSEETVDKEQWQSASVTVDPAPGVRVSEPAAPSLSDRLGDSDYYIRLAEKRLTALSPEQASAPRQKRRKTSIGSDMLQDMINRRGNPGAVLACLDVDHWAEVLSIYEDEIGLQYPYLDVENLKRRIRLAKQETFGKETSRARGSERIEDLALMVHAIVSILADSAAGDVVNALAEEIFTTVTGRAQLNGADKDDLSLLILSSTYFFLTDREIRAWRGISVVMRLIQELSCRSSMDDTQSTSPQLAEIGEKMYWSAYTLDRRWSFGTGMPFAIQDSDIRQHASFPDDSLSSAYLKNMISYCNIASEVRRSVLDSSVQQPTVSESTRDFLNFRLLQWQRNLPPRLQFGGIEDKLDESKETRGEYKLRLMLYLRANQMRTLIFRKLAVQAEKHSFSPSSANVMADVAQDTLRILIRLARETTIYHAQHKAFNHFLETALSSLLLIMCCEGAAPTVFCLEDVVAAIELVQQLSTQSPITRRLGDKLQGIQDVVRNIQSQRQEQRQSSLRATSAQDSGSLSSTKPRSNDAAEENTSQAREEQTSRHGDASEVIETAVLGNDQPATTQPSTMGFAPSHNGSYLDSFTPTAGQLDLTTSIDQGFDLAQAAQFLDDNRLLQFPELGDILRDYDYFGF